MESHTGMEGQLKTRTVFPTMLLWLSLCFVGVYSQTDVQVRLVGGEANGSSGRLEMYYQGEWNSICTDQFQQEEARVVCKSLGYVDLTHARTVIGPFGGLPLFGILDNPNCLGAEPTLLGCSHSGIGNYTCLQPNHYGISCLAEITTTSITAKQTTTTVDATATTSEFQTTATATSSFTTDAATTTIAQTAFTVSNEDVDWYWWLVLSLGLLLAMLAVFVFLALRHRKRQKQRKQNLATPHRRKASSVGSVRSAKIHAASTQDMGTGGTVANAAATGTQPSAIDGSIPEYASPDLSSS